jgi:hypothetical protein
VGSGKALCFASTRRVIPMSLAYLKRGLPTFGIEIGVIKFDYLSRRELGLNKVADRFGFAAMISLFCNVITITINWNINNCKKIRFRSK